MKVEYVKCDICGTKIEYDPEVEVFKNKFKGVMFEDDTHQPQDNRLILQGYTYKNVYDNDHPNKVKRRDPCFINLNLDLCDSCLNYIHNYINGINQRKMKEGAYDIK